MSRHLFGWSLPPGCSHQDIERAMGGDAREPVAFEDQLYDTLEPLNAMSALIESMPEATPAIRELVRSEVMLKTTDAVMALVGRLVEAQLRHHELLIAARNRLPPDPPPPACTCKPAPGAHQCTSYECCELEWTWCELHDGDSGEPTLRQEIEDALSDADKLLHETKAQGSGITGQ
jgi:hypothetical protein